MSKNQQLLYEFIVSELKKGKYHISIPKFLSIETLHFFIKVAIADSTEFFNYNSLEIKQATGALNNCVVLKPIFSKADEAVAKKAFDDKVDSITDRIIKPGMKSIQKVLAIYNYLISEVAYDAGNINNIGSVLSHTAYGALVNKKAVCEGIANAFCCLAKKSGIECAFVSGIANGCEHAWNMIRIGQNYYHIDATWDIRNHANLLIKTYDYFCLCDRDLKNRRWNKSIYPPCTSLRYNYFNVTDSYAHNTVHMREIILRQARKNNCLYFKYDFINMNYENTIEYIWNEIISVSRNNNLEIGKVSIFLNKEQCTFIMC